MFAADGAFDADGGCAVVVLAVVLVGVGVVVSVGVKCGC